MFRILGLIAFMALPLFTIAQDQSNPFDLKYRKPNPPASTTPVKPKKPDTTKVVTPVLQAEEVPEAQPDTVLHADSFKTTSSNPFDIKKEAGQKEEVAVTIDSAAKKPIVVEPTKTSPKQKSSKGLQIFFLLLSLLFLIFIVNVERSFVRDLWRVISNENYSSLHHRNQRNTMRQILLLMGYAVFIIQAGIFLYHTMVAFGYQGTLLDNIWSCMLLVSAVYTIRHIMISYLKWLFNNDKEMTLFGFDVSIFNIMIGLVLLPINVMLNFGPESLAKPLIYIGITVAVIAYLMRQLRWLLTARHLIANSLFLFFVYLCAVEILPLWAISKFFW